LGGGVSGESGGGAVRFARVTSALSSLYGTARIAVPCNTADGRVR
jgi:hypothetical protein